MITYLILGIAAWAALVTLLLVVLHRLSPERDRQDREAPTHTQTGEAAR